MRMLTRVKACRAEASLSAPLCETGSAPNLRQERDALGKTQAMASSRPSIVSTMLRRDMSPVACGKQ